MPAAHAEGLVLTEDGAVGPKQKRRNASPSGLSEDAQGMDANWPRQASGAGSVHDSPVLPLRTRQTANNPDLIAQGIEK